MQTILCYGAILCNVLLYAPFCHLLAGVHVTVITCLVKNWYESEKKVLQNKNTLNCIKQSFQYSTYCMSSAHPLSAFLKNNTRLCLVREYMTHSV